MPSSCKNQRVGAPLSALRTAKVTLGMDVQSQDTPLPALAVAEDPRRVRQHGIQVRREAMLLERGLEALEHHKKRSVLCALSDREGAGTPELAPCSSVVSATLPELSASTSPGRHDPPWFR